MNNSYKIFLLIFVFSTTFAQKKHINIDSIYTIFKVQPDNFKKVDTLIYLYKKSIKQHEIRKDILEEALEESKKLFYIKGIGICYNRKGITARYEQDYLKSIQYHKRALTYLERYGDDYYISKCLNSLGVTYRKLNLEKEAFDNYFKALKIAEKTDNKRGITISLNGIGNVFLNTEQYDKALFYLKKALVIETLIKNSRGQEYGFANVGEVFLNKKQYDSAFYYFDKSLAISLKNKHNESTAIKYYLFGLLYQKKGDFLLSSDYFSKAIPDLKRYNNTRYLSKSLINIGINQIETRKFKFALENITKGLKKAKIIKSKETIMLGYKALTTYYKQIGDYKKALKTHELATIFHDSIINLASQKSIISTQIAYGIYEKDKKIQKLASEKLASEKKAKQNRKNFIISILIALFLIFTILLFFYVYQKNKDLELNHKNTQLQNYLLQINELKVKKNNLFIEQDLADKFAEFELSKREIEVLEHISLGLSNSQIADKMFISNNTIKTHISHIYSKLDVKNRVQALQKITSTTI